MSILTRFFNGFRFAATDVVWSSRLRQFLRHSVDDFGSRGVRQLAQLVEGIVQFPLRDALLFQANQERALPRFLRTRFNHALREPAKPFGAPNAFGAESLLRCD